MQQKLKQQLSNHSFESRPENQDSSNYLTKEKQDEIKEMFMRKKDIEGLGRDVVSFQCGCLILQENGFYVDDMTRFELLKEINYKFAIDLKDLLRLFNFMIGRERKEEKGQVDSDYKDAFTAVSGTTDQDARVTVQMIENALEEFGLTIDMKNMLESIGVAGNSIGFDEFIRLFENQITDDNQSMHSGLSVK